MPLLLVFFVTLFLTPGCNQKPLDGLLEKEGGETTQSSEQDGGPTSQDSGPVLSILLIPSVTIGPGQTATFTVTPSYGPVIFAMTGVELNGESFDISAHSLKDAFKAATGEFFWTPSTTDTGTFAVAVSATDQNGVVATAKAYITVSDKAVCGSTASWCTTLKQQFAAGKAAGHYGDYYQNNDNLHANYPPGVFPQLTYLPPKRQYDETYVPGKVIVGNASLAVATSPVATSFVRYYTFHTYANQAYQQYRHNSHFWHPEHLDHDAVDKLWAKVPFISLSQGSSGSEIDDLQEYFLILASYKPEVKAILKAQGLLMPTTAMIYRRAQVASDAVYLTGVAHPSAFDNNTAIDLMGQMASQLEVNNIPPMVQLKVISQTFNPQSHEVLFDTPVSICRTFRTNDYTKRITVSAEESFDVNSRPLTYTWSVLRGNPAHVRIVPQNAAKSVVQIEFDYHPEAVIDTTGRTSNMVEVGAFVNNGAYYSAPGFVTSYTLNNETRTYDGSGNLLSTVPNSNVIDPHLLP